MVKKGATATSRISTGTTRTFAYELEDVVFYGYSGTDSCGRKNVAISNEMAGDGEGTKRALGSIFGKVTCYPIHLKRTTFANTPLKGTVNFRFPISISTLNGKRLTERW